MIRTWSMAAGLAAAWLLFLPHAALADVDVEIDNGDRVESLFAADGETVFLRVTVPAGARLSASAKSLATKSSKDRPSPVLRILGPAGNDIGDGRVKTSKRASKAKRVPCDVSDVYTVEITAAPGTRGKFRAQVKWSGPKSAGGKVDLAVGETSVPFAAAAGTSLAATLRASGRSGVLPGLLRIENADGGTIFDLAQGSVDPVRKAKKLVLPETGDYRLVVANTGSAGTAKAKVKLRAPRSAKRRIVLDADAIGDASTGGRGVIGTLVGPAGGQVLPLTTIAPGVVGAGLVVPGGALPSATPLFVGSAPVISSIPGDDTLVGVGPSVFFGPSGQTFAADVTITLPFDVAAFDGDLTTLRVVERQADGTLSVVDSAGYTIDELAGTVSFVASHFTSFRVFGPPRIVELGTPLELLPTDILSADEYGFRVAVDGDTAVISSFRAIPAPGLRGAAYVFVRDETGAWSLEQKLTAPDGFGEFLGGSLALRGDELFIGAAADDEDGFNSGAVYVFRRDAGDWSLAQKLSASFSGNTAEQLGASVSLAGDVLAVGAPFANPERAGPGGGAVVIYERSGSQWEEVQAIQPTDLGDSARFGEQLVLQPGRLLVAAPGNADEGSQAGAAFVYEIVDGTWERTMRLSPDAPQVQGLFGLSLALEGNLALVSQGSFPGEVDPVVYVFRESGGAWTQVQRIIPEQGDGGQSFGRSMVLNDGGLLLGAPTSGVGAFAEAGQVHVYSSVGGRFEFTSTISPSQPRENGHFGQWVALDAESALVGARGRSSPNPPVAGTAFVFPREE